MPEISEAQLSLAQKYEALFNKLSNDPKEGMSFKRTVKKHVPDANFPELDIIDTTTAPILEALEEQKTKNKSLEDRLNSWEQSQKDSREESALQSQLDGIRKQYSFTSDGMQKVIDRMKEKNNPDAEAAAAWVASQERKSRPITDSALLPSALNLYGSNQEDADFAELNRNPQGWADKKIVEMLNEFNQDAA